MEGDDGDDSNKDEHAASNKDEHDDFHTDKDELEHTCQDEHMGEAHELNAKPVAEMGLGFIDGVIKSWFHLKGFGFIAHPDVEQGVFLHRSAVHGDNQCPQPGDEVRYMAQFNDHNGK